MIKRVATCDDANSEVEEVRKALETKDYIYWGNDIAYDCDYLFIHSQGDSTIKGILKVRDVKDRKDISKEDFLLHRPEEWESDLKYPKYFIIEKAKIVNIPIDGLKDGKGNPKNSNAMREMSFIDCDKFEIF